MRAKEIPLVRDHDHKISSKITIQSFRGWLCSNCNTGLGLHQDDPEILRAAAEYLERERPQLKFVPPERRHHGGRHDVKMLI